MNPPPLVIELPWPPTTNTWLRHFVLPGRKNVSTCISARGREFYAAVGLLLLERRLPKLAGALAVVIELYPPDRRKIDVDNRNKPILDALKRRPKDKKQLPGAWLFADDDSQVKDLRTILWPCDPGRGRAVVTLTPIVGGEVQTELFAGDDDDCPPPEGEP
jgi:Holliday junction resolvase RusA-like endonuclease